MSKIYLDLSSGLGNQLFQFSFGYSLARQFNNEWVLRPSYFDSPLKFFLKKLLGKEARNFRLPLLISKAFEVAAPHHWKELVKKVANVRLIDEAKHDVASVIEVCAGPEPIYLKGYRQNERYFTDSKTKSLIICNSTFSGWSAYLTGVPDSLIICPQRWHLNEKLENSIPGLISPYWRKTGNTLGVARSK